MARVLVVEDERSIRRTLEAFLAQDRHDVVVAEDGEEALAQLEAGGFDVVVSDLVLPKRNGIQLLQAIRQRGLPVQVILMTGEPSLETAAAAIRARAFDYLSKPVAKAAFLAVVAAAAAEKRREDEHARLVAENRHYQQDLERLVQERTARLQESETRFSTVFRASPVGIGISRFADGRLLEVNEAFLRLFGGTIKDASECSAFDLSQCVDPEDGARLVAVLRARGRVPEFETRFHRPSGDTVDLLVSAELVELAGELCLVTWLTDITHRKAAEERLARLARVYQTLSLTAAAVARVTDETELFRQVCDIALRLGGFRWVWVGMHDAARQVLAARAAAGELAVHLQEIEVPLDPAAPGGRALAADAFRQGTLLVRNNYAADPARAFWHHHPLAQGLASVLCLPLRRRGQVVGVLSIGSELVDHFDAEMVGLFETMGLDVSLALDNLARAEDLRVSLAALRESEARFRAMFESAHDLMVLVNEQGRTLWANPAWQKTLGYTPGTLGDPMEKVHPDDRPRVATMIEAFLHGRGDLTDVQHRYRTARGDYVFLESSARKVLADGSSVFHVVAHDITERKRLEGELLRSQKLEAVGRLCAGVSHEYNNVLMGIVGHAAHLQRHSPSAGLARQTADRICRLAERATQVSRQLLTLSGQQPLMLQDVDLDRLVQGEAETLVRLLGEPVRLRLELAGHGVRVQADPAQIPQVLLNLLLNARDAMPKGGDVTIATARVSLDAAAVGALGGKAAGEYALIRVADTGCGMSAATVERACEPFFTTKPSGAGAGLGLACVRGIVASHHGFMHIASSEGQGTQVSVYLLCAG